MSHNRIWIALDHPRDAGLTEAEANAFAEKQCRLANAMLARLGDSAGWHFSWDEHRKKYQWGGAMSVQCLTDSGTWLNLDYLAKGV